MWPTQNKTKSQESFNLSEETKEATEVFNNLTFISQREDLETSPI